MPSQTDSRRIFRLLCVAVVVIFAVKLAVDILVISGRKEQIATLWTIGRADLYHRLAKNIAAGHGYRFTEDTSETLMREPGYPYFLAGLIRIGGDGWWTVIAANLLLTSLSALLISHLSRSISTLRWVPLIAPLLYLSHPGVIVAELRFGIEVPFTCLLLCFLILTLRALHSGRIGDRIRSGLALGVTCIFRSTALLFPLFVFGYEAIKGRTWRGAVRAAGNLCIVGAATALVLAPWTIRNYHLVGKIIPTASVGGVATQTGYYICTHEDGHTGFEVLDRAAAAQRNELAQQRGYHFQAGYQQFFYDARDEVEFNSSLGDEVTRAYLRSPATFVKCASENLFNFWFAGKYPAATRLNICVQLPYLILALLGIVMGYRTADRSARAMLLLFVVYTVAVYAPIHAQARYSIPLVPILAIFGAIPLAHWLDRRRPATSEAAGGHPS